MLRIMPYTQNETLLEELYQAASLNSLALPVSDEVPFTAYSSASGIIEFATL